MRETEQERVAALIATDTMEEAVGDIRLADALTGSAERSARGVGARASQPAPYT